MESRWITIVISKVGCVFRGDSVWDISAETPCLPEGRTQLNTSTGAMVLRSLNHNDTGKYTPEINNRILDPVQLSVIGEFIFGL